jgi:hypothetical protein
VNNAIDYEELENRREDMLPLISLSEFWTLIYDTL